MDVNQAVKEMMRFWDADHKNHAMAMAWNIKGWLDRGGFAPVWTASSKAVYESLIS